MATLKSETGRNCSQLNFDGSRSTCSTWNIEVRECQFERQQVDYELRT